ncbi:hypothetical protein ACIBKX_10690 [Streptomyces sp. NPDC050658]
MAVLAVFIPVLMLGIVLALGRYEEWLLPPVKHIGHVSDVDEADAVRRAL